MVITNSSDFTVRCYIRGFGGTVVRGSRVRDHRNTVSCLAYDPFPCDLRCFTYLDCTCQLS